MAKVELSENEIQLIYAACMSYGNKLAEMLNNIPNEPEIFDKLGDRAKESWNLARKIVSIDD